MRTILDLTEDAGTEGDLPSPTTVRIDDGDVVVAFRETELRLTFPQFVALHEACGAWMFRYQCDGYDADSPFDTEQGRHIPAEEHERLRKAFGAMVGGGVLEGVEVPEPLRAVLRRVVVTSEARLEVWRSQDDEIHRLEEENRALREEVAALKRRRRKKEAP